MALSNSTNANQVIFEEIIGARKVILNRRKELNTLNYEMLRLMSQKMKAYEKDPTIKLVILKANGKVFCVGGDLISGCKLIENGHWSFGVSYYRKQLCLDYILATYKKPLIAILDGSVMGGGVGISIHSTIRIVTENTVFAMPEASIGLFPDVGASYFLSRLPGFFGEYLGLTGGRLDGPEMRAFGLATHFVPSQKLKSLETALENMVLVADETNAETVSIIMNNFTKEVPVKQESVYHRLNMINKCFSGESCEEILASLERLGTQVNEKWIHDGIKSMKSATPIGLKIFLRLIRQARSQNIKQCLETEYTALSHVFGRTVSNDFYEWMPSRLEEVTDEMVAKCFAISFDEDDDWLPLQLPSRSSEFDAITSKL